jgi:phospholipid/cholesterol/gamma-HCH transport system substrate-binding protein
MNLRREVRWLWPIAAIMVLAVACGGYILNKQRLENPFAERYTVELEFDGVDAVTPGLGSPLTVAGVSVGQIDRVRLEDGVGVLRATVDPAKLPAIHADATAALIPNTPLEDMQIGLHPGSDRAPRLPDGGRVALRSTTTAVESDELLQVLDADTRTYLRSLIADLGVGTKGRGRDLNRILRTLGPTAGQLRRITELLGERRKTIASLVHDLRVIAESTAGADTELRQVVDAGQATLGALATEEVPLRRSLELLPPTLRQARTTLDRVQPLAGSLRTALAELDPSLRTLRTTLQESPDALRGLIPLPLTEFSQFVRDVAPLSRSVRPAQRDLFTAAPLLERSFKVLGRATNAFAYQAGPNDESSLFYLAWFVHNAASTLSTQDAHGAVFRGYALFSCGTSGSPIAEALFGTTCPEGQP